MASMNRIRRLGRDESGMSYVFIGMGMMAFLSASMLAIDVGMLMTARSQAQNSADAGALAGATALLFDDFDDRSADGPAVRSAIAAATANQVMRNAAGTEGVVSVTPDDVEFLNDPMGEPTRVKVTVYRTAERGNPVSTLIAQYFGVDNVGIGATATAEVSPANAMTCVKPFTIPDKWREVQTAPWDGEDTYDAFDNKGQPLANPDVYIPATESGYTGYNQESSRGERLVIRAATGNNITVSFYYSLSLGKPVITGGDPYRWNIANCNTTIYHYGDPLTQEPGAMEGPTIQGADELIAKDPNAYWDEGTNRVKGSAYGGQSPRVFPIPLYDPVVYDSGKRNGRTADLVTANWIGFFLESTQGNGIWGRIIPIAGIRDKSVGPAPQNLNPKAIRLVE
jgi:Flp pilus assembly protein TadG